MREDAFVSLPYFVTSTIREISEATKNNCTKQSYLAFNSFICLKRQGCPARIKDKILINGSRSDSSSVSLRALGPRTPILCSFFYVFNKLGRGISTLALYIAWYSEENAENIRTDLPKCFLCTSL